MSESTTKKALTGLEIAVIGMAGRFPGANDIDTFWENLKNGEESATFFSDDESIEAGIEPDTVKNPRYVKAKGYLEEIQYFDSEFFNYTPKDAAIMDPQVRVFHECAWQALENSGYDPQSYPGLIGLYAGYSPNILWKVAHLLQNRSEINLFELENLNSNFFTTLICYKLDLKGPGVSVNTACSTSLVAIHLACRALLIGEADIVLAGGVYVTLPPKDGYLYQEGMVMSSDGHGRPFDAKADGTFPGNGVGIVVSKRLVKAVKDRDHIYAVIKGTAINNDGSRKTGYTAPSVAAQSEVIRAAMHMAGVEAESISYIETHGTATSLGDPIEIAALKMAFAGTNKKKFCRLGFIKANIGHLDAAAGVAGFIKTTLALHHRFIPPAVNFHTPNPKIDFENSPFYIDINPAEWKPGELPLRAGVSSFGIGGTNAHAILEEYMNAPGASKPPTKNEPAPPINFNHLLLLSAKTQTALDKMTKNLAEHLIRNPGLELADVAYTRYRQDAALSYRTRIP
jgi:acyl transferase domain-containing protein